MATTVTCSKCGCIHASDEFHQCPDGAASIDLHPPIVNIESAEKAMELWPTLDNAYGCEDCRGIFLALDMKAVVSDGIGRCPRCGSESCFDAAVLLNRADARTNVPYLHALLSRHGKCQNDGQAGFCTLYDELIEAIK